MDINPRKIPAGEFKTRCLALLDDVARTGEHIIVTKRGKPVAKVVPIEEPPGLEDSVIYCGDIISPAVPPDDWEMNKG